MIKIKYLNKNIIPCQSICDITFFYCKNHIKITLKMEDFDKMEEMIKLKLDTLDYLINNFYFFVIIKNKKIKLNKFFLLILKKIWFYDISIYVYWEKYILEDIACSVFCLDKENTLNLGNINKFGWYDYYYADLKLNNKKIKNYFITNELKLLESYEKKIIKYSIKNVVIEKNPEKLSITISSPIEDVLIAVELWAYYTNELDDETRSILIDAEKSKKYNISTKDKIELIEYFNKTDLTSIEFVISYNIGIYIFNEKKIFYLEETNENHQEAILRTINYLNKK